MPIYMDRHDVSESVSAELVAQIHQEDLRIQESYGCRGLTYWFDDRRKTAFCLIEAPHEHAIVEMHAQAHGQVPNHIIEVDPTVVESFLGRIEDPVKNLDSELNVIDEAAFRTIMIVDLEFKFRNENNIARFESQKKEYKKSIAEQAAAFSGTIVRYSDEAILISFRKVAAAMQCALQVHSKFIQFPSDAQNNKPDVKIALHAGVPVTDKQTIFEDTIRLVRHLCQVSPEKVVVSCEVRDALRSENLDQFIHDERVVILSGEEEKFLTQLMDFIEKNWQNTELKVDDFNHFLGLSESQAYRKMIQLTGKSPKTLLLAYRLKQSLKLFQEKNNNISEIAYDTGFNSPSYFSKCFRKNFGITPSLYQQLLAKTQGEPNVHVFEPNVPMSPSGPV